MKTKLAMIFGVIIFAGSFNAAQGFSEDGFDTGRFSDFHYGEKFYQYKYSPPDALAGDSYSKCYFTSDFVLDKNSFSESGYVKYKFPNDMNWPGGYENSTYYIITSSSLNFPEDNNFQKIIPTKTEDDNMVIEFDLMPGLNTFLANSTAFWDSQNSQIIDCLNPFDFEKQDYEYYDFVYPLKIQYSRAMMYDLNENNFLCKSEHVLVLKYDGSPACVTESTKQKLVERNWIRYGVWTAEYGKSNPTVIILPGAVIAENKALDPETTTVVLGVNNTVTWINRDDVTHTLISDHVNDAWWTGLLKPGESSSVTFNNTGIFNYHGTPGPWITGTVIVMED